MAEDDKGRIFLKLILDTLGFRQYFETYVVNDDGDETKTSLDAPLYAALVDHFGRLLVDLEIELEDLGYEVVREFYTDNIIDDSGYELGLVGEYSEDDSAIENLKNSFHAKAWDFTAELPGLLTRLASSTAA